MSSTSTIPTSRSTLPPPTGTHPIGRISTECEDRDRVDPYAPDPSTPRHLVLWIWYPADPTSSGAPAEFLPRPWTPIADQLGVDVNGIHTHAVADAPAADRRSPVLLLSPSGFSPLFLGSIAEELASHGYVVVGVNHTFETAVTVFSGRPCRNHEPRRPRRRPRPPDRPARSGVPSPRRGLQLQGS